jgi:hypothetical protein
MRCHVNFNLCKLINLLVRDPLRKLAECNREECITTTMRAIGQICVMAHWVTLRLTAT